MDENQNAEITPVRQEVFLEWTSPSRLFKQRNKEYYTNIGAIVVLLVIILIFAREFLLIAAVLSIVFFIYVLSTVPPEEIIHRITNLGIESAGTFYRWEMLDDFWFEEQWGQVMLVIRPIVGVRIIMLLSHVSRDQVREILTKHIPYRDKPDKNWVDNVSTWLSQKIPLEKPTS